MNDKYHLEMIESATRALEAQELELLATLPAGLRPVFALVAAQARTDPDAAHLALALRLVRTIRVDRLPRPAGAVRLSFLLALASYLHSARAGWQRAALAALGALAAARTRAEAGSQVLVLERALALSVGELAAQVVEDASAAA